MAPVTTSLRGQQSRYFVYRSDFPNWSDPEGDYTKDENVLGQSEAAELQQTITDILADPQNSIDLNPDPDAEQLLCLTYNPITDEYAIRAGSYVL